MNKDTKSCILCGQPTTLVKSLDQETIKKNIIRHGILNNINMKIEDYDLIRCLSCGLEFSDPMVEPSSEFYKEITQLNNKYYADFRWEWGKTLSQLNTSQNLNNKKINLIDVGCGSGFFLKYLRDNSNNIEAIGIDSTPSSIKTCKDKGLNALCCTLDEFKLYSSKQIDIITFWHLLEHVADPMHLVQTAQKLVKLNGSIYFSVPLSPTYYETIELHPLNLPPHHLTRWSIPSLLKLAEVSNSSIELYFPKNESFIFRTLRSMVVLTKNEFSEKSKMQKLVNIVKLVLKSPFIPFKAMYLQLIRPKYQQEVLPDVILVKLKKI